MTPEERLVIDDLVRRVADLEQAVSAALQAPPPEDPLKEAHRQFVARVRAREAQR